MWTIIKFEKKKFELLKKQLRVKLGNDYRVYCPKLLMQKYKNNRLIKKELNLLGDYLFCFNKNFENKNFINQLKYYNGVKYILEGFSNSQKEINDFILKCKAVENNEGFITQSFFETKVNKFYKFSSGPFTQRVFKIIEMQKNKIKIFMGNLNTTIDKREYLFNPL
jgi:hypothetical protein|tara:strand:+ start:676 stop:1173 length:498 start_codon:yes stop_codon:yes gene_type:complete